MIPELRCVKNNRSDYFWNLINELLDDESEFLHNRTSILDAYVKGNLYGLEAIEKDEPLPLDDFIYMNYTPMLPLFLISEETKAVILWVHSRIRRMGFGRKIVQLAGINEVWNPLPESIDFWNAVLAKDFVSK
jgi:hypothetical protein